MASRTRSVVMAVAFALALSAPLPAAAQAQPAAAESQAPKGAAVVWVTTTDGQERKGRLVSFTPDQLVLHVDKANQIIRTAQIARVDTTDSISNGIRNGAIAGGAFGALGLALIFAECEGDCSGGEVAAVSVFALGLYTAIGAGLGGFIDHLIDGRRPIYTRSAPSPISVQPIVGLRRQGIQLRVRW